MVGDFSKIVAELVILVVLDILNCCNKVASQPKNVGEKVLTYLAKCCNNVFVRDHPIAYNFGIRSKVALVQVLQDLGGYSQKFVKSLIELYNLFVKR